MSDDSSSMMEEEWVEYDGGVIQEWHWNASHIRVGSGVAAIPPRAFMECDNLVEVELCEGIQRIGKSAFFNCSALVRVTIPPSVTDIEDQAFNHCRSLAEVEFHGELQRIGKHAFQHCEESLIRINIPASVVAIEEEAFRYCTRLKEVTLNEGLQRLGRAAFEHCPSLERITIPSSVTVIGGGAFYGCSSLAEVTLHEGVHFIYAGGTFYNCTSLAHINIPPVSLVIDMERGSCQLMREMMPATPGRKLIVSKWMQFRSPEQLALIKAKVNEIMDRGNLREEPRDLRLHQQTDEENIQCIREWCAYWYLVDVTTMLELGIWRCNMGDNGQDAVERHASRRDCGSDMNVIIPGVLEYLEPGESEGSPGGSSAESSESSSGSEMESGSEDEEL